MERNVTKMIIATILQKEEDMRRQNRMRLPMNYITEIVKKYQTALPMLTVKSLHNALNYERGKRKKNTAVAGSLSTSISSTDDSSASIQATDDTETNSNKPTTEDPKIGRPKGTTIRSKREQELKKNACYNEVTVEVAKVREQGMKMSHDHFEELVLKVKKKLALPEELAIKRDTVDKRIQRKKLVIDVHESKGGSESPLSEVEPTFVEIILMMSTIKEPLTPPEIKDFINSAIHGTEYQKKLIEFKKRTKCKQNEGKLGKVGARYVRGFLKRWENWIHSKKPQRFELDRGQWARYSNFSNMYDSIENTLVENGVATKLRNP